mgnify:CR=1 FL=1
MGEQESFQNTHKLKSSTELKFILYGDNEMFSDMDRSKDKQLQLI